MSAIAPNGEVLLLRGVNLDKSYNHTYRFSNEQAQINYFKGFVKPNMRGIKNELITFNLTNQLYQRVGQNVIRVGIGCDYLYDINYMMFKNNLFQVGKWFYAFVDEVRYINPNCSEVVYTIDVMQTWKFDYELGACFVEREHTNTDEVGDNIVPENFDNIETYYDTKLEIKASNVDMGDIFSKYVLLVYYIENKDSVNINITDGIINAVQVRPFILETNNEQDGVDEAQNFIQNILTSSPVGEIVSIVQVPTRYWISGSRVVDSEVTYFTPNKIFKDKEDSYTIINNKLLTYPYTYIEINDYNNKTKIFKFEHFYDVPKFAFTMSNEAPTELYCIPIKYLTNNGTPDQPFIEGISTNNVFYPSWTRDSYIDYYLANNDLNNFSLQKVAVNSLTSTLQSSVKGALLGNTGGALTGLASSSITGLANMYLTKQHINIQNNIAKNLTSDELNVHQYNGAYLNLYNDRMGFCIFTKKIILPMAKIIDDYFNMFGYAINEVKVPQTTSRPYWNYVKTNGCIVHAVNGRGLPADAEQMISSIYDNGITFWNSDIEIGDYSYARQNRPI